MKVRIAYGYRNRPDPCFLKLKLKKKIIKNKSTMATHRKLHLLVEILPVDHFI